MAAAATVTKSADGIVVPVGDATLRILVCADNTIRVAVAHDPAFFGRQSYAVLPHAANAPQWQYSSDGTHATVTTAVLQARVHLASGTVDFLDLKGRPIVRETQEGRTLTPVKVQGEDTFHVRQQWDANADEALFGMGEHHLGLMNIKGYDLDLWQHNGTHALPFLVSSRGYGIFWDNTSYTRFGDPRPFEHIPAEKLYGADGKPGGLTSTGFSHDDFTGQVSQESDGKLNVAPRSASSAGQPIAGAGTATPDASRPHRRSETAIRWEGEIEATATGDHLFRTFSNGLIRVWIDGKLLADHWRQGWLPWYDLMKVSMKAGQRYKIRIDWQREQGDTLRVLWKTPAPADTTSIWSEAGEGIDYYFIYGPQIDQVVAGYRQLTGAAPLMPKWAYGLWQCRQRYETAQQSLDVIHGFRQRDIPFDNIVQDWMYWPENGWGSHQFDTARFPDPEGWLKTIHNQYHAHLMISAWPKFYLSTENGKELQQHGYLYTVNIEKNVRDWIGGIFTFYDAFNPDARKLYWKQVDRELFSKGVDAWWLDGTEPDLLPSPMSYEGQRDHMMPTAAGISTRVGIAYPLLNCQAVYEGQRQSDPNRRVFILTRSCYAGQQRYAGAAWSGDITSTWTAMKKQITAGLGFSISGQPYWTQDVGGFAVPQRFGRHDPRPEDVEEWRELNTRWFQWGTFTPLLRVHGEFPYREMWEFGGEAHPAYKAQLTFDRLRYRLLPYIYSLAGQVTHRGGTMMRPLVMDFRGDAVALNLDDQFMFGPAFMVSPVTTYKTRSRDVYLPKGAGWYEFWNGAFQAGGQAISAPAPYESIPLYIKAGSIIPVGPELQYTGEKPADPVTLYVYTGADGAFTLYEDEGLNYNYEKGAFTQIPLEWNEATKTLTIGKRIGSFAGMLETRTFDVVFISANRRVGFSFDAKGDKTVKYTGEMMMVMA